MARLTCALIIVDVMLCSGGVVPRELHGCRDTAAAAAAAPWWRAVSVPGASARFTSGRPQAGALRLRGGHRVTGFKRRDSLDKMRTSRRIHSMARPRAERKRAAARERQQQEADGTPGALADQDAGLERDLPANRNLFRRNMGEWAVEIAQFKREHPAVFEEDYNTRIDSQTRFVVERWQESVEMPDDDEEELDKRTRHPDWIKKRGISHYNLAMCHDTGYGVGMSQRSPEKAFRHYLAAAELGHPEAMCCAGSCLMYGKGVPRDVGAAVEWYIQAAQEGSEDGSYDAMFNLGMCFRKGIGRPRDPVVAMKWFRAAAKQKHPDAMYALAMACLHGYGDAEQDAQQAVKELLKICDRYQHKPAQLSLAKCFVLGVGVERDEEMGLKMCMLALEDNKLVKNTVDEWKGGRVGDAVSVAGDRCDAAGTAGSVFGSVDGDGPMGGEKVVSLPSGVAV